MKITYDAEKRALILETRGLDFDDAVHVFAGPVFDLEDDRKKYGDPLRHLRPAERANGGSGVDASWRGTAHHHDVESE